MRIVILSDTHIPDFARSLPPGVLRTLRRTDLILHAGDVTSAGVLDELEAYAPVHVAMGNNDGPDVRTWGARDEVRLDLDGARVAMIHDSGPRRGREGRLRRRFPDVDMVIFGHSHIPVQAEANGLRLFNPGSPTWKRRQPAATYGVAMVSNGVIRTRLLELPS